MTTGLRDGLMSARSQTPIISPLVNRLQAALGRK
jgi:hypothetical protein